MALWSPVNTHRGYGQCLDAVLLKSQGVFDTLPVKHCENT